MCNILENNIPTVYVLENGETVYLHLEKDGSVLKLQNEVVREKGSSKLAPGTRTFSMKEKINSTLRPKAVEEAVCVTNVYAESKQEVVDDKDSLLINVQQGQNCIIGFMDKQNENFMGGMLISTFSEPVSYGDRGFWENSIAPNKLEEYCDRYGKTNLSQVKEAFEAQNMPAEPMPIFGTTTDVVQE